MYCHKCGTRLEDGSLFCSNCGTKLFIKQNETNDAETNNVETNYEKRNDEKTKDTAENNDKRKAVEIKNFMHEKGIKERFSGASGAVIIAVSIIVLFMLIGIPLAVNNKSDGNGGSVGTEAGEGGRQSVFSVGSKQSEYSHESEVVSGKLKVSSGNAELVCKSENYMDSFIILPDFEEWSGGEIPNSVSNANYKSYDKKCGKTPDLELVEEYLTVLKDTYGFSVTQTEKLDPTWIGEFSYVWLCTKGENSIEVKLHGLTEGYLEYLTFSFSDKIRFLTSEECIMPEETQEHYDVIPEYDVYGGNIKICMDIPEAGKKLNFYLARENCSVTKATMDDFNTAGYQSAGSSYFLEYYADGISSDDYISSCYKYTGQIEDIRFEVLDPGKGYPAVYFYVVLNDNKFTRYYLEGVCAPAADAEPPHVESPSNSNSGTSGGSSINNNITVPGTNSGRRCAVCRGTGEMDCHTCGGDGKNMCTLCHGTGTYRAYGQSSPCSCNGGNVTCTSCHGKGSKRCTACNGEGTY